MLNGLASTIEAYKRNYNFYKNFYNNIFESKNQIVWENEILKITRVSKAKQPKFRIIFVPSIINDSSIFEIGSDGGITGALLGAEAEVCICHWKLETYPVENLDSTPTINNLVENLTYALDQLRAELKNLPQILAGYCLGGNITLAAASLRENLLSGVSLFATPWDFNYMRGFSSLIEFSKHNPTIFSGLQNKPETNYRCPSYLLQMFFFLSNPYKTFERISKLSEESSEEAGETDNKQHKFNVEQWLYSCKDIPISLIEQLRVDFIEKNCTMNERWLINDICIKPEEINLPSFVVVPKRDCLVYPISSEKLVDKLNTATVYRPGGGHLSFLVGKTYKSEFEDKFINWSLSVS